MRGKNFIAYFSTKTIKGSFKCSPINLLIYFAQLATLLNSYCLVADRRAGYLAGTSHSQGKGTVETAPTQQRFIYQILTLNSLLIDEEKMERWIFSFTV